MCAHYKVGQGLLEFLEQLGVESSELPAISTEFRPTNPIPIILTEPHTGENQLKYFKWGLIPNWAKDPKIGTSMINARSETIATKPAYKDAFQKRRCIIPIEMFYEYDATSRYRIQLKNGKTMGVAGIWEESNINQTPITSCSLITTESNQLISKIHDRMPALLKPEQYDKWLNPKNHDTDLLQSMLKPNEEIPMTLEFDSHKKSSREYAGQQTLDLND